MVEVSLEPSHSTTDYPSHRMQFYILVIAMLVDMAVTGPLMRTSHRRVNNQILSYQTATHSRHETGRPGYAVEGSYSYIGADGQLYKVTYQADHRGFRAQGAHLPWSLPVYNTIVDSSQSLNVMKEEVAQVVQVVSEEEKKEENISVVEAAEQEVAPEITINEGQGIPDEGLNALEIELAKNQATLDTIQSEGVNRDENLTVNKVVKEEILPEITPETTQMEVKNDNTAVQGVEDQISILPELIETEEELIKDEDFVLMEDELPAAAEPTEQLTIHVPLIAKVYSLQKATKPGGKPRKTNGKTSRIIRYKLAYQPSWRNGESALIPISE